ncbi:hypothetical protein OAD66_06945 [Bacteroidia bacterium]|jgi:hypothetical protein|nr:hypothetical protein [Bacteroidia bacterium]
MKPDRILKIVLAIASLICVLDMPYGYYQLYRFIALGAFLYLAYTEQENKGWLSIWIISALLVQPFFKVALGRDIWNIVDVIFAVLLVISVKKK